MKKIRAKFVCLSISESFSGEGDAKVKIYESVSLGAVTSGSEENKSFSEATPAASLSMSITNKDAFGAFEKNKEYYIDFTPAEAQA